MARHALVPLATVMLLAALPAMAAEKVTLRAANGRFVQAAKDGSVRAEAVYPSDKEIFELVPRGKDRIALKGVDGRYLTSDVQHPRKPRLGPAVSEPGDAETFDVVPTDAGRFTLRSVRSSMPLVFGPDDLKLRETVEIYRVRELPAVIQTGVPMAIRSLAVDELADKQYDKTRKRKKEKFVELPAPTIKDPGRKKRHQVLGMTEEYRVQAKLDGQADVRIPAMPLLSNYAAGRPALMLIAIEAQLPVSGRVQYKVPDVVSASTGFQAGARVFAAAEIQIERSGGDWKLNPPTVLDVRLSISRLRLSNDLLDATREPIERFVNHELRRNEPRIREKANKSVQKAMSSHEVRIPLLGYLETL